MSIEIGGVPTGAENINELFETENDSVAAKSWLPAFVEEVINEVERVCDCDGSCKSCDDRYLYT